MDPKKQLLFPIPSTILKNAIEYSHEFVLRLQIKAAALASLDSSRPRPWHRNNRSGRGCSGNV